MINSPLGLMETIPTSDNQILFPTKKPGQSVADDECNPVRFLRTRRLLLFFRVHVSFSRSSRARASLPFRLFLLRWGSLYFHFSRFPDLFLSFSLFRFFAYPLVLFPQRAAQNFLDSSCCKRMGGKKINTLAVREEQGSRKGKRVKKQKENGKREKEKNGQTSFAACPRRNIKLNKRSIFCSLFLTGVEPTAFRHSFLSALLACRGHPSSLLPPSSAVSARASTVFLPLVGFLFLVLPPRLLFPPPPSPSPVLFRSPRVSLFFSPFSLSTGLCVETSRAEERHSIKVEYVRLGLFFTLGGVQIVKSILPPKFRMPPPPTPAVDAAAGTTRAGFFVSSSPRARRDDSPNSLADRICPRMSRHSLFPPLPSLPPPPPPLPPPPSPAAKAGRLFPRSRRDTCRRAKRATRYNCNKTETTSRCRSVMLQETLERGF